MSEPNQSPEINAYAPDGVKMPADHLDEGSIPDSAGGPVDSGAGQDGSGTPLSQERASETPASAMYTAGGASILKASEYDFSRAENHLLSLQQELRALKIPVVILLEGWSAAGKGDMAGELLEGLDPRGYHVYVSERFGKEERSYPELRPYWVRMPKQGDVSLFIGSWYHPICAASVRNKQERRTFTARLEHVNQMEQMLVCDGVLMLKFFINISRKEQKHRLRALSEKKATRALVKKSDWAQNERYDQWQTQYNLMLAATNDNGAVWHVLRGEDRRECKRQLYESVIEAFQRAIAERRAGTRLWDVPELPGHEALPVTPISRLSAFNPNQTPGPDYKQALDEAQKKLRGLQYELYRQKIPMVLAFEGWDAAGKGGSIRRLTSALDPRGFTVIPISAPTAEEKAHHHLWRFWRALPEKGHIAIFDRTWYGRVMVERIEGFCTESQWRRAYEEINLFERDLAWNGAIIRKFWLQIDPDEQLRRFIARRDNPEKQWKITDEDWRNREKWPEYEQAVNDMLAGTHTRRAPWIVVEANNKQYARLKVLNSVIAAIEERLNH